MIFNTVIYLTLLFSTFVGLCENVPLPPYFSRCSKTDPRINECIAYNAGGGLHAFVKGDEMYNIQSLTPVYIPKISLNLDRQLTIHLTNSIISDFESARIEDVKIDLENRNIELNMFIPKATLMGQYHLTGKMFLLTFDERGPVNMTVLNSLVKYGFNYILEEKGDKHFINITNSTMTYQPERAHYIFYEFMSNTFLKDIITKSMNENWAETHEEFEPIVSEAICKVTTKSLKGFFQQVSYEELLGE